MTDVGEMLLQDVKIIEESIDIMEEEELLILKREIDEAISILEKVKPIIDARIRIIETKELTEEEVEEEYEEKEEEIEEEIEKKPKELYLPAKEYMTIALYKRLQELGIENPKVEKEAKEIISKYNLTEEDIEKIYETVYG